MTLPPGHPVRAASCVRFQRRRKDGAWVPPPGLLLQRRFGASTGLATIAHTDTSPDIWRQYSAYRHVPMASVVVVLCSLASIWGRPRPRTRAVGSLTPCRPDGMMPPRERLPMEHRLPSIY